MDDDSYLYLKRKINKLTRINLDHYKSQQMRRRMDTYLIHTGAKNIVDYCHMLEKDGDVLQKLLDFLTINVSEFFRDVLSFEKLQTMILPLLLQDHSSLNIWSAGCSRGQEPFTMAMILDSLMPSVKHRILATDVDAGALQIAASGGPYNADDVKNMPPRLKDRYLTTVNGKYMISGKIRDKVEFKKQNILVDEFEKGFHLILCRNVTIYFTDEAKRELNRKFYESLSDGGVLFIGSTEVMLEAAKLGYSAMGVSFYQKPALSPEQSRDEPEKLLLKT